MKRTLFIALMTVIIFGGTRLSAGTYSGGTGLGGNPYIIATAEDLIELSQTPADWTQLFIQTADIVFNSNPALQDWDGDGNPGPADGFSPIGDGTHPFPSFADKYNGQNFKIYNLYINRPETDYVGLFGHISAVGGHGIINVHLVNANITGNNYVGGLVGYNSNCEIRCCSSSGSVTGSNFVGGLVGFSNNGTIWHCSSSANVTGTNSGTTGYPLGGVGGFIGRHEVATQISHCHASGTATGYLYVGGFAGWHGGPGTGYPSRCFATGNVSGTKGVGGFAGRSFNEGTGITYCYSTGDVSGVDGVGGFVGELVTPTQSKNRALVCYSLGSVTRASGTNLSFGGFCGHMASSAIEHCYSIGKVFQSPGVIWNVTHEYKGFAGTFDNGYGGSNPVQFVYNFFDYQASQQNINSPGAFGKTTSEMKTQSTYSWPGGSWGFGSADANWVMSSPVAFAGYPTFNYTGGYSSAPTGNQIASLPNLVWLAEDPTRWSDNYTQTEYINAKHTISWNNNKGWKPIGNSVSCFSGNYDGQGNVIDNLYINRTTNDSVGLFTRLSGGTISNFGLINANISGREYVGILVGYNQSNTLSKSFSTGSVSGVNYTGGLAGKNETGSISNSYSLADVSRSSGTNTNFGAFCGYNSGTVEYCYSIGTVAIGTDQGFIGAESGGIHTNNFFDQEASGQSSGTGATAKTTAEMKTQATFSNWNFTPTTGIWEMLGSGFTSYPYLNEIIYDVVVPAGSCTDENPIPGKTVAPAASTYSLTYDANTGTGSVPVDANSPYEVGEIVTVIGNVGTPTPLSKTDHTFGGWNTQADGNGTTYQADESFNMPANNVILYAIWTADTYSVTYHANGGSGNVPVDANSPYEVGESVTVLGNIGTPALTKQYHTFGGWNTMANGNGTTYQPDGSFNMPDNNVVLYAIWTADTYTVTYDANGGTGNAPLDANSPYEVGESVTVLGNVGTPAPLSKTDFTFGGWNTQADGNGTTYQADESFNMPADNVVLYAIWNPNSSAVTYDANGGTGTIPVDANSPYTPGSSVTVLGNIMTPPVTKQYHTFGGWNTQADGNGTTYQADDSFTMPSNAVTLYALWVPDTYTITYDANTGSGNVPVDGSSPYAVGASVTVLGNVGSPVMTKQYHTFGGWNTQADGGGTPYQAGGNFNMPDNNVTLYAIWTADTYTVTYDANGGTGNVPVDGSSPYEVGESVTVLGNTGNPALTKQYHTFGGWNTQINGGGIAYQVGGSFNMPDNNVTLYAIWTADTYTVTYDANDGTGNVPVDGSSPYEVGESVTVLGNTGTPALTKQYHTFGGWNTMANGNGTTYQSGNSFNMPDNNVVLYAIWTADTYTVTYDANGGTGNGPVDANSPYEVGESVTVLGNVGTPNPLTKTNYTFGGWNTQADGNGTTYQAGGSFSMPDNNVVLYAIWTADTYTVTYDANGGTGNAPVDGSSPYTVGASVTVLGNVGIPALTKPDYSFDGWNTQADGNGTPYQAGNQFNMPAANVTLFAIWTCTQIKDVLVSIRASKMPGNQVKFKAYPINGGDAPYYKWYRADGSGTTLVAEGLNMDEFVTTCKGGDEHWVELISSLPCTGNNATAASNPLCTF